MKHLLIYTLFMLIYQFSLFAQPGKILRQKALQAEEYRNYPEVVLLDSTVVTVAPTGTGTFSIYKAILIQSIQGALNNRVIRYDYDPLTAFAKFRYATIHKADGRTISLDIEQSRDYVAPARSIYWGARQIMLEIGRLAPGDILEYEIDKKGFTYALLTEQNDEERFIPPMRGEFYDIVPFWCQHPTLNKIYQVSLAQEKDVQFQFYQGECTSSVRYENNRKVYRFSKKDILPFPKEQNMVDLYDAAPKLMMSSTPNWKDKSLWFNKTNEDYESFKAYAPAQKKVNELVRGKKTEMEKIAVLTHWVADNIRYAGITMGKGEGFTLHDTEMNYTDRCGVCKDIAGTLISFLRMAGFEAYPAMTMAGSRVESIPADHFNHCVAVVKLSNGTYMPLDPTWVPFCRELWSSAEQQQNYLPGLPEGSDLCITPISDPANHYVRIQAKNKINKNGTLTGQFTITAEGQSDRSIRRIFTSGWQSEWMNTMEKQLLAVSPKARLLRVDWGKNPKDYQAAPIKITFQYEIPEYVILGQNEMLLKPFTMNNLYNQVRTYLYMNTDMPQRKYGFKDACSRLVEIEETIQIPKDYRLYGQLNSQKQSPAADFDGYIRQEGDKIKMHQQLILKKRVYEAEDWEGFRNAVEEHKSFGNHLIIRKN